MALGLLATRSFDYLCSSVLAPWSGSEKAHQRLAVAYALRVISTDPRLRENARSMVSGWSAGKDNPLRQATAARAYGLASGLGSATAAFEALERLSAVDDIRVAIAIGDSTADLLETGTDDFACTVLARLADAARVRDRNATVQLVFLILADSLVSRAPAAGGSRPVSWPYLLRLATRLSGGRTPAVALWQRVIKEALFHEEAEQVMTRWAGFAEREPEIREAFLRLARAIARVTCAPR